jgi:hypothetical protein
LDRGHETIASTATVDDRQNARAIPSVTGGLADLHSYPLPWTGDFHTRHGELGLADPPGACSRYWSLSPGCGSAAARNRRPDHVNQAPWFTLRNWALAWHDAHTAAAMVDLLSFRTR